MSGITVVVKSGLRSGLRSQEVYCASSQGPSLNVGFYGLGFRAVLGGSSAHKLLG